jgi:hypothetical protein
LTKKNLPEKQKKWHFFEKILQSIPASGYLFPFLLQSIPAPRLQNEKGTTKND